MKKFVYLLQTETRVPLSLSDLQGPDSDVVFLSWKAPASGGIFFPFSTWTEGRNRLLKQVIGKPYQYFIFIDDDITLRHTEYSEDPAEPTWRAFERYLLEYEPAVGFARHLWHRQDPAPIQTVYYFDPCVHAIHREALNVLLPYYDDMDSEGWWFSGCWVVHLASVLYPSHVHQYNQLESYNRLSREYPRPTSQAHADNLDRLVNQPFQEHLLDEALQSRFHPITRHDDIPIERWPTNGEVLKKAGSYELSESDLAQRMDPTCPYWRRRTVLAEYLCNEKSRYPRSGFRLSPVGEKMYATVGKIPTWLLFMFLYQVRRKSRRLARKVRKFLGITSRWIE